MPTYSYQCDACGHKLDKFQSIKDDPLSKCPECGKRKLRRLLGTGAAIMFKGSGFYITDYRSESYKKSADAEKSTASSTSETAGKTDSTPAAAKPAPSESKTPAKSSKKKAD